MKQTRGRFALGSMLPGMVLLLMCGPTGAAWAEENETEVAGIVTAVDVVSVPPTITVTTAAGPLTLNFTAETEIEIDDDEGSVADLSALVGLFAEVEYDPATNTVHEVEVENEFELFGEVVLVEGTTFPYRVTVQPFRGPATTLIVTAETEMETEDDAPITDLSTLTGHFIEVEYDARTFEASEIELDTDDKFVTGTVLSLDLVGGVLVVRSKAGDVSFVVSEETDVELDFQEADLADLAPGKRVLVNFEVDEETGKNVADEICAITHVETPASGILTGVSDTGNVCSVRTQKLDGTRPRVTATSGNRTVPGVFKVNAGTVVLLDNRPTTLDQVPPGCRFHAKYVMQDGIAIARKLFFKLPPPVPVVGTIRAVTLAGPTTTSVRRADALSKPSLGTIEVTLRNGTTVVSVAIYPDTSIKLNGTTVPAVQLQTEVAGGAQIKCQALCIPVLEGTDTNGKDLFSYHAFRLSGKKVTTSP